MKRKSSNSTSRTQARFSEANAITDFQEIGATLEDKGEGPSQPRHRVTSKGSNVPEPVETFEEMRSRYNIPSRIVKTLEGSGYRRPTAIQAHGCPVLLGVSNDKFVLGALINVLFRVGTWQLSHRQGRAKHFLTCFLS